MRPINRLLLVVLMSFVGLGGAIYRMGEDFAPRYQAAGFDGGVVIIDVQTGHRELCTAVPDLERATGFIPSMRLECR